MFFYPLTRVRTLLLWHPAASLHFSCEGWSSRSWAVSEGRCEAFKVILISDFSPSTSEPMIPSLAGIVGKVTLQLHCVTQQLRRPSRAELRQDRWTDLRAAWSDTKRNEKINKWNVWLCSTYWGVYYSGFIAAEKYSWWTIKWSV